jgi:hypothetical protein
MNFLHRSWNSGGSDTRFSRLKARGQSDPDEV